MTTTPISTTDFADFDPDVYYKSYYSTSYSSLDPDKLFDFYLDSLSEVYNSGSIQADTLLDFGTGPVIHNLISAARHFPNIYLSDYSENNRNSLWKWLSKDPQAYDFSHFFKRVAKKENLETPCEILEEDMRSRVKGILQCDMSNKNPLYPSIFPKFDVINTSLCLLCAPSSTREAYETAVKNVSNLLKDGGWIVYIDALQETYYRFGEQIFSTVSIDKEFVINSFSKADLQVDVWKQFDFTEDEIRQNPDSDGRGMLFLTAQKKAKK